jgi:hypothetical protein
MLAEKALAFALMISATVDYITSTSFYHRYQCKEKIFCYLVAYILESVTMSTGLERKPGSW